MRQLSGLSRVTANKRPFTVATRAWKTVGNERGSYPPPLPPVDKGYGCASPLQFPQLENCLPLLASQQAWASPFPP
eukprot:147916-Chlamydomonas_euryale.AAC.1